MGQRLTILCRQTHFRKTVVNKNETERIQFKKKKSLITSLYRQYIQSVSSDDKISIPDGQTIRSIFPAQAFCPCCAYSICAAATEFMASRAECTLERHATSTERSCCHCARSNVRCIVLDTRTVRAAWSMRARTSLVFNTEDKNRFFNKISKMDLHGQFQQTSKYK